MMVDFLLEQEKKKKKKKKELNELGLFLASLDNQGQCIGVILGGLLTISTSIVR